MERLERLEQFSPLHPNSEHLSGRAQLTGGRQRATDPSLAAVDIDDTRPQLDQFRKRRRLQIGHIQIGGNVADARRTADRTLLLLVSVRDCQIQAVTVDEGGK